MKRVMLAYDASPGADVALSELSNAALGPNVAVRVVSLADVWLPSENDTSAGSNLEQTSAERVAARQHATQLLALARQHAAQGAKRLRSQFPEWTVEEVTRADSPAWAILAEARDWPADLIVLGSHGRSSLEKFFLGSVSYKVAAEAQCSVRISRARIGPHEELRVIVAIDGSNDSKAAIEEVLSRSWPTNAHFQIIAVADARLKAEFPTTTDTTEWLKGVVNAFRNAMLNADACLLDGEAKAAILKEETNSNVNCIFLGARGLHHRDRLYLGTTASAIASRAHCSVEIFRPKPLLAQI